MEVFDHAELEIVDYDHRGRGIGKVDGAVVFLDGGHIGDVVEVEITKKKKRFYEAHILRTLIKSALRAKNPCPYTDCGGCAFLELSREAELAWKKKRIEDALARIGDEPTHVEDVLVRGGDSAYRNHMQFHVRDRKLCLYGKNGESVPVKRCMMQTDSGNRILFALTGQKFLDALSFVGIRTNRAGEVLLILVGDQPLREKTKTAAVAFAVEHGVSGLYYSERKSKKGHYGERLTHIYGKAAITEELAGYRYGIAGTNFFQVNPEGAEAIIRGVADAVKGADTVVELYSGIGMITLPLHEEAKEVVGVEISADSVDYARKTAEANGVKNVRYIAGAAEDILPRLVEEGPIDVIVCDPPRAGLHETVVKSIQEAAPASVIYVSCNPATLARDIRLLGDAYRVEHVQPIDMFPRSAHVEAVVLMTNQ